MNKPSTAPSPIPDESEESGTTVPVWLIVVMFLLLYWGAMYFELRGGWFSPQVYAPYRSVKDVAKFVPTGGDLTALGKDVYGRTCVACHQPEGQGAPGQWPPLAGSDWVNEKEPGRIIRAVLHGLQGPIVVNGKPFPTSAVMNGFGTPPPSGLTDEQIAAVLTFVRQNKAWGNSAPAVTPEQVKAVREKTKDHVGAFTPDQLLQVNPAE